MRDDIVLIASPPQVRGYFQRRNLHWAKLHMLLALHIAVICNVILCTGISIYMYIFLIGINFMKICVPN